jgi:GNAT superfamily N-acetyltransferase
MHLEFRPAVIDDLQDIVRMLADDFLGRQREQYTDPLPDCYTRAFREIDADPNNEIIVVTASENSPPPKAEPARSSSPPYQGGVAAASADGVVLSPTADRELPEPPATPGSGSLQNPKLIATLQLTYTPSISFRGGRRCTVQSVRVDEKYRGRGIGRELMLWAIERAKQKGCIAIQLTTDAARTDAHRFYENVGFKPSHLGMKLPLTHD